VFYLQKQPTQTHTRTHIHTQYTQHGYKPYCYVYDLCFCWFRK